MGVGLRPARREHCGQGRDTARRHRATTARMECLVRILLWSSVCVTWTTVNAQFSQRNKEVFFVNLEEGFFGCQVNETADVLQIFNKLCDGVSDCYRGSDENSKELKCSNNCLYTTGHR